MVLVRLNAQLRECAAPFLDALLGKGVFGLYLGWVTAASLINALVLLVSLDVGLSPWAWSILGSLLVLTAAATGILARFRLRNFTFPLAIAWAATGIGVAQSGHTLIVVASAIAVIVGLVMAVSFVMDRKSSLE